MSKKQNRSPLALELKNEGTIIIGTVAHVAVIGYEQNGGWYEVWRAGDEDGVSLGLVQVREATDLPAAEQEIAGWLTNSAA
jgi:hypothetical protein